MEKSEKAPLRSQEQHALVAQENQYAEVTIVVTVK